jgi:hypothetical protein
MPKAAAATCGESTVVQLADIASRLDVLITAMKLKIESHAGRQRALHG